MNLKPRFSIPRISSARLFIASFSVLIMTGCTGTGTPITVNDSHVFLPSLRAAASLDDGNKRSVAEPQTGHAVEFEFVKAKGSGEQSLGAGQLPVVLNNMTFTGPQQLRNDFDLSYVDLSYRWRKFFMEDLVGLELSGGVGHTSFGLSVNSPAQSASEHFGNTGPQGGVALILRMRPGTSIHTRLSLFVSKESPGVRGLNRFEFFVAQVLGENLALRAGYAKWEVNGDGGVDMSDFKATFSGPVLDVGLNF